MKKIIIIICVAMLQQGCMKSVKDQGTAIGMGVGAVVGGIIGNNSGKGAEGAALGAVLGGAVGRVVGSSVEEKREQIRVEQAEREREYQEELRKQKELESQIIALETSNSVKLQNEASGQPVDIANLPDSQDIEITNQEALHLEAKRAQLLKQQDESKRKASEIIEAQRRLEENLKALEELEAQNV